MAGELVARRRPGSRRGAARAARRRPRDRLRALGARQLVGRGQPYGARDVLRAGASMPLLARRPAAGRGCACRGGRTARRRPWAPRTCGPPSETRSAPSAATSRSTYGAAWTASTWNSTPLCGARPGAAISAIGWIVPTSLLASMIETRIVRSVSAASSWSGIHPSVAVDRQLDDLEPELLEVAQRVADGVVLDGGGHDPVAARLAGPRGALEREVVRLGAAGREHDLARLGVQPRRDPLMRLVERRPGRAARTHAPTTGCRRPRSGTAASRRGPRAGAGSSRRGRGRSSSGRIVRSEPGRPHGIPDPAVGSTACRAPAAGMPPSVRE